MTESNDNVVTLDCITTLPLSPVRVLKGILEGISEEDEVIVIVKRADETTYHFSNPDIKDSLYQVTLLHHHIVSGIY